MEIRIGTIKEHEIKFDKALSEEEYASYKKAVKEFYDLISERRVLEIVILNYRDYISFLEKMRSEFGKEKKSALERADGEQNYLQANRNLLNILSSVRTFLDHSNTYVSRKYGKESAELKTLDKATSFYYDNHFSYRFLYRLRNYAQHCGMPLGNVSYNIERVNGTEEIRAQINIKFKRDDLLNNYDGWGIKIKEELQKMPHEFDAHNLISDFVEIILNISMLINSFQKKRLINGANHILNLVGHMRNENTEVCIFHNVISSDDGNKLNFEIEHIPFDIIDETKNEELSMPLR